MLPITSLGLIHTVSNERIGSGVPGLDDMLGGEGYYRGSGILVSGKAGTGKRSMAAHFADAACQRGERCLYFAFEEPMSHFISVGTAEDVKAMLVWLIDFLKLHHVTCLFTSLTHGGEIEQTDIGISSLMDSWLLLRNVELNGERNRTLYVLKSRGMAHSNQLREMLLTKSGIRLVDVYLGPHGALTGAARLAQEARETDAALSRRQDLERRQREMERKREALEARVSALRLELEAEEEEARRQIEAASSKEARFLEDRQDMARVRGLAVRGLEKGERP